MFQVGVLLLAAGTSRRFGGDKRAAVMPNGKTVLAMTLDNIKQTDLPLKLCLTDSDRDLASNLDLDQQQLIFCRNSANGMGATLADGMAQIEGWQGVIIALGDMPWVQPQTYSTLRDSLDTHLTLQTMVAVLRPGVAVSLTQTFINILNTHTKTNIRLRVYKYMRPELLLELQRQT